MIVRPVYDDDPTTDRQRKNGWWMETYALYQGNTDYSLAFAAELEGAGVEIVEFSKAEELEGLLDEGVSAVILLSPHVHLPRIARTVMEKAGGLISHIPLLVALLDPMDELAPESLRHVDDFLVRPAGPGELICRVEVLRLKRGGQGDVIGFGDLSVNLDAHQVFLGGRPVDLTYKEFELLKMLAATPGRAYSRDELLRTVWGYDYFGGTRTVDVHVRRLRAKIETSRQYIETVHGVGYRFVTEETASRDN